VNTISDAEALAIIVVSLEMVNWNIADNAKGVNSSNQTRITLPRKCANI
jgi:hypothetical protein